jgi:transposase-like protein
MNESIMKTDRFGRLRYAPEQKAASIEAYLTSGMSAPRFAALHGVNYQTLVYWIKKSNPAQQQPNHTYPALLSLIPAEINTDLTRSNPPLELSLPDGAKLLISSRLAKPPSPSTSTRASTRRSFIPLCSPYSVMT